MCVIFKKYINKNINLYNIYIFKFPTQHNFLRKELIYILDFVKAKVNSKGKFFADFQIKGNYKDLMIKGGEFYAMHDESTGFWVTKKTPCAALIDDIVRNAAEPVGAPYLTMLSNNDKQWDEFLKFTKKLDDNAKPLDNKIIFKNQKVSREDYASKTLPYELKEGECPAWEELIGTLYLPEERAKLEWAIGAVLTGDSKNIQKFIVMYGKHGTGKSTILNIIAMLTEGYNTSFDSEALGDLRNTFSLEAFADDPLVGIEHDGDLSRITTNTRLNMIVSHEKMRINEKFKRTYPSRIHTFLFMGTNSPVKITDSKSGLIRRLIDVYPSGDTIPPKRYKELIKQVEYELGAIAHRCIEVYNSMGIDYYYDYKPSQMLKFTNNVYDFLTDEYDVVKSEIESNGGFIALEFLWIKFKEWAEDNNVFIQNYTKSKFRLDVSGYFDKFEARYKGVYYSVFIGLKTGMFKELEEYEEKNDERVVELPDDIPEWLKLKQQESKFDIFEANSLAQYATEDGTRPMYKWENCKTHLSDIDTKKLHFVKPTDEHHIFVDFDGVDENGNKSLRENIKKAVKLGLPPTYAETSKSGGGLHLHYIYDGDVKDLSSVMDANVEIKMFPEGKNSSMRRKLTICNNLDIAHISSGLPFKETKGASDEVFDIKYYKSDKAIRKMLVKCMQKGYSGGHTVTNVSYAKMILDKLYASDISYDVSDMRTAMRDFAAGSTHQSSKCLEMVADMKFCSREYEEEVVDPKMLERAVDYGEAPIVFFDVEVFPNLFVLCYKFKGKPEVIRLINPTPDVIKGLFKFRLVGFNNLEYDNHICYARALGYSNRALYDLSRRIIKGSKDEQRQAKFPQAKNISYTDIYDFSNDKKSLKKWEIALGIHHLELGLKWDEEVPEELWETVAEYCCNDVEATEAVWNKLEDSDWVSRIVLSELSGLSVNESTNNHTQQIIFGNDKHPQKEFNYPDLSKEFPGYTFNQFEPDKSKRSLYKGVYTKEGGWAHGEPGIWYNCALLDVNSMHPSTAKALNIFGDRYTARYYALVETRLHIKHGEIDEARAMFDGAIGRIMDKYGFSIKKLDKALKVPINAVYGLTSASFPNRCRDPRNIDNVVAKRGALFMVNLREEVNKRGFEIAHVKTDSVKIPNATPEIIQFVMDYGKKYGYTFEHEATYEKMCLVNDAVYIAKYQTPEWCQEHYGYIPKDNKEAAEEGHVWTATGTQFQVPYVFKTLFSHEPIEFTDMCETKSTSGNGEIYICDDENEAFVGRVGLFCPMKTHGGALTRIDSENGKRGAVTGTKGYLWMESENVKNEGLNDDIDISYYGRLCDDAVATIEKYGSFEEFVA